MAVLLVWVSWREPALAPDIWHRLRQRAAARTLFAGRELAGPGWRVFAAPGHCNEADPISQPDAHHVRLLDWVPFDAAMASQAPSTTLTALREGPPLAAIELELADDASPVALSLARDVLGRRSLVYTRFGDGVLVASGEHLLLGHPGVSASIDRDFLTAFLCLRAPPAATSAFSAIRTLPAGEWTRFESDAMRQHCCVLQPDPRWREMTDRQVGQETTRLLDQATARCLFGSERAGLSMSAGVDSLAVAGAISRLPEPRPGILAITYGLDHWPSIDERSMASLAADRLRLDWQGISADSLQPLDSRLSRPVCPDTPLASLYREFKEAVYLRLRDFDAQVWLSGAFGDHLTASPAEALADALRFQRWRSAIQLIRTPVSRLPAPRLRLLRRLAARLVRRSPLPPAILTAIPSASQRKRLDQQWCSELAACSRFPRPWQARSALDGYAMFAASGEHWFAQRHGMHAADPYRDVDLTRWLLSLPADLQHQQGQAKSLLRAGLPDTVPKSLRERPKSSDLTPFLHATWERQRPHHRRMVECGVELVRQWEPYIEVSATAGQALTTDASILREFLLVSLALWHASLD